MRKLFFGIIVLGFLFCSCKNGSDDTSLLLNGDNSIYEIPAGATNISFPSECNGKKAFAIYLNQTSGNISKGTAGIQTNQSIDDNEYRSSYQNNGMVIYEDAVDLGNGLKRSEVHFELPFKIENPSNGFSRTLNTGINASYNNHDVNAENKAQFYAQTGENTVTQPYFTLKAEGDHCRVWYKESDNNINDNNKFETVKTKFDTIFVKETQVFGSNSISSSNTITATANTKIDILIYDLYGDNDNGDVMGFFRPLDFYTTSYLNVYNTQNPDDTVPLINNECQLINIDSYYLKNKESEAISTLAHEFTHLLIFCHKYGNEKSWFTEMMAMCSEDIFQQLLELPDNKTSKGRFDTSFNTPWKGFKNWPVGNQTDPDIGLLYANTYAFGAYLMRNYGGLNLINQIATNNYVNEGAITMALQSLGYQEDFSTVLKKFGAIYVYPDDASKYSLYKNVTQNFAGTTYNLTPINLNNYYFLYHENTTQQDFINFLNTNCYYQNPIIGHNSTYTNFAVKGPTIYKSSYNLLADSHHQNNNRNVIQTYGFIVYYLGQIKAGQTYNVTPVENMTTIVCTKD